MVKRQSLDYRGLTDQDKENIEAANDTELHLHSQRGQKGEIKFSLGGASLIRRVTVSEAFRINKAHYRDEEGGYYIDSGPSRGKVYNAMEQIDRAEKDSGAPEGADRYISRFLNDAVAWRSSMIRELQEMDPEELKKRGFSEKSIQERLREIDAIEELRREILPGI